MRRIYFVIWAAAMFSCQTRMALADEVASRAWVDSIRLPTYREGPADPIPHYGALPGDNPPYPYAARTTFTNDHGERAWRTLNLENEYLFCRILPDWGGHLYNCRDKRNNREVFYANPVIKPGPIGMRTAWIATGIESNFPIGHSFVSASPVDYGIRNDPEGSARAVVDTKIIMPARVVTSHTTPPQLQTWLKDPDGKDGTLVSNRSQGGGWFGYGTREPFFGAYKPNSRSGIVHVADPAAVSGKKLWVWGTEGDKYVRTDLTDGAPSYIEIQGGVFQEQETFAFLEPGQSKAFSHYWIPAYDLDGITRATQNAILHVERRNDPANGPVLAVEVGATRAVKGATIRVLGGGAPIFETRADLTPASTYSHVIEKPGAAPFVIQIMDAQGSKFLEHTEGDYDSVGPEAVKLGTIQSRDWTKEEPTESFLLERGDYNELYRRRNAALSDYSKGMERFPNSVALKKAAGRLNLTLNRFAEATRLLTLVLAATPGDAEAIYYFGAAQAALGQDEAARLTLGKLTPDSPFMRTAALPSVGIAARSKDYAGALARLTPVLNGYAGSARLGAMEVALLRRVGRKEEATKELSAWLDAEPANSTLRFERTLTGPADEDLWQHLAADSERVLDIADLYLSLGMFEDALQVLDRTYPSVNREQLEPGAVPAAGSPLIGYYRAYCRGRLGQDAKADLQSASKNFGPYVFPWRPTTFAVLTSAIRQAPDDAVAHFLMGRLFMHDFMPDEAIGEWQKARTLNPRLAGLNLELSTALIKLKNDPAGGLLVAKEGLSLDPGNVELRRILDSSAGSLVPAAAATSPGETPPTMNAPDAASGAMLRAASNHPDEALQVFRNPPFAAEKQPDSVRRAYIEVQLQKLLTLSRSGQCPGALDSIEKIGHEDSGLPFTFRGFKDFIKQAHFQYYLATVEAACKESKSAQKRWAKVASRKETAPSPEYAFPVLAAARINATEARPKIAAALESVRAALTKADAEAKAGWLFLEGMLLRANGEDDQAASRLQEVAKSSKDVSVTYLALVEMGQICGSPCQRDR